MENKKNEPKNGYFANIMAGILIVLAIGFITNLFNSGGSSRETDAWTCAQDLVISELKYDASSAKFGSKSDATITDLGNDKWRVKGTVEAKNAYGTYVKKSFTATFTMTSSGYKEGYVTFK